jgi:hypothetical protein
MTIRPTVWTTTSRSFISTSVSEAHAADDRLSDRDLEPGTRGASERGTRSKSTESTQTPAPRRRRAGRPKRADAPVVPWDEVDRLLVFGEVSRDPVLCVAVRNVAPVATQASRTTGSWMFRAVAAVRWPATLSSGVLENPEDVVCRLIEVTAVPCHVRLLEALAHHLDVGFRVAMRCGDLGVSEPSRRRWRGERRVAVWSPRSA